MSATDLPTQKFLQIDEQGYLVSAGQRVTSAEIGQELLSALSYDEEHRLFSVDNTLVEPFDAPLVVQSLVLDGPDLQLKLPYEFETRAPLSSLTLDEWDRFHGYTHQGIAFVLSRQAQGQLFDLCDNYDDNSVTIQNKKYLLGPWLASEDKTSTPEFWDEVYRNNEVPRFDLQAPAPSLVNLLDRLKLPKSRVAVLGAGGGHDAAYFAERGHLVTAFDFSQEALKRIRQNYPHVKNLNTVQADVLKLPREFNEQFDLVFEHTCYCAIGPADRNKLVSVWRRLLVERGQLLGIFFAVDKIGGPPFGGSEWEVRARLQKAFQFLYWSRTQASQPWRLGKEFTILGIRR